LGNTLWVTVLLLSDKGYAMPKAAFTLTWSAASRIYQWSGEPGGEVLSLVPDSPACFAWLAEFPSFAFHRQEGNSDSQERALHPSRSHPSHATGCWVTDSPERGAPPFPTQP